MKVSEDAKRLTVLCVDDEENLVRYLAEFFGNFFKSVDVAYCGAEAIRKHMQNDYDIIFTDEKMPNMKGSELIPEIRKINEKQVIASITAFDDEDTIQLLQGLGVNALFSKPTDMLSPLFFATINDLVELAVSGRE